MSAWLYFREVAYPTALAEESDDMLVTNFKMVSLGRNQLICEPFPLGQYGL